MSKGKVNPFLNDDGIKDALRTFVRSMTWRKVGTPTEGTEQWTTNDGWICTYFNNDNEDAVIIYYPDGTVFLRAVGVHGRDDLAGI